MARYTVIGQVAASVSRDIDAESVDAALEAAYRRMSASVCHQCSRQVEVGDIYAWQVLDESGELLHTDERADLALATTEELEAELARRRGGE